MIPAAAVLVLIGLGLFVAGAVTGTTLFYWLCVGTCVLAGVFLVLARIRMARAPSEPAPPARPAAAATAPPPATPARGPAAPAGHPAPAPPEQPDGPPTTDPHARRGTGRAGDPPVEEVEVTDLLLVVDMHEDVLVVDEHPRYHVEGCRWLTGRETVPLPVDEARTDGFTPCGWCRPDSTLAQRERARRPRAPG